MFSFVKIFFIFITFLFIASCHEKDYDILRDFIMKDQQAKNLKKLDTIETDKTIEVSKEKQQEKAGNLEKKDKQADSLETKKPKKKKFHRVDKDEEKKELKVNKNTSRILETIESQNKKILETQSQTTKIEEETNFNDIVDVGVMLPLSGEHSEIGNLILNAIEMAVFQTEENKLQLHIKDTEAKPDKAKKVLSELIDEGVKIIIGPLFSKSLAAIQSEAASNYINILALTNNINLRNKGIWIFGVDPQAQTEKVLRYALEKGSKNIAALLPQNAYGLLLFDTITSFAQTNLMKIEKIEFYNFSVESQRKTAQKISKGFEEYKLYLDKIKEQDNAEDEGNQILFMEKPFDSVFIAAAGQNLTVLSSQLQYNNVDPKIVQYLGISSWEDIGILNEPALEGGVFVTTSEMYQKKIKPIYKKSFSKEMPKIAMIAYDIVALLGSLNNLGSNFNIYDLVNDEGYIGLRGLFRLKKNGVVERAFQLKKIKNKKFTILKKANDQFSGL
ncbi:penicillin-binding protein activator [Alphaproteobacteria bacterium]|nr:penicillin-binding protein activator [Alphaproteobacteria bacterium]